MNYFRFIGQDWQVNTGNSKGRLILVLFRMANFCSTRKIYYYLGFLYLLFYRIMVEWVLGIEIPWNTKIGKNLRLFHGQALVVNKGTIIGENCVLRHSTTIGNKQMKNGEMSESPNIGNFVDIGSNVCIIGEIQIQDHVMIGCGSVVVKNVAGNTIVIGNPAQERARKS